MKIKSGNGQLNIGSLQKGLVGHWTMSQDSLKGSLLADKTPYGNDGTIYGATFATDRMGQPNKAMSFDGVDDYIMIENQIDDKNIYEKTISVWLNVSDFGTTAGNYISKKASGYEPYRIEINNTSIYFWYSTDSLTRYSVRTQMLISKNQWINLLCVFNNGTVYFYKNGELMGHGVGDGSFIRSSVGTLFIGARKINISISNYFNGSIDDVRIYNRVLSEQEIKTLYNSYNPNIKMKTSLPKIKLYGGDNTIKSEGYIRVDKNKNNAEYFENPLSNLYGKTYFYVMQYQARNVGGVPTSTGTGLPWRSITQIEAKAVSEAAGYHLTTNWEWMAIARDIEQVAENWTGGAVGSGMIKRGNVGTTDDGSYNGADPETGILNDKAKLKLSNGEEIYHFSGNVWEWVDAQIPTQADMKPAGRYWPGEIKNVTDWGKSLTYSEIGPKDNTFTRSNGVGGIYYDTNCISNRAFARGGYWVSGASAGVFALALDGSPTGTYSGIGFRCAR